jgi:hypothetical protein
MCRTPLISPESGQQNLFDEFTAGAGCQLIAVASRYHIPRTALSQSPLARRAAGVAGNEAICSLLPPKKARPSVTVYQPIA